MGYVTTIDIIKHSYVQPNLCLYRTSCLLLAIRFSLSQVSLHLEVAKTIRNARKCLRNAYTIQTLMQEKLILLTVGPVN